MRKKSHQVQADGTTTKLKTIRKTVTSGKRYYAISGVLAVSCHVVGYQAVQFSREVKEKRKMTVERIKLKVTEVAAEPKPIGTQGAKKLEFKATTPDNKTLPYFTFTKNFFPLIVKDKEIDVDVDTTQKEYGGNTYTDRKVTQFYENGQPVGGQGGQRNFGNRYANPEERASIEAQVAAKIAGELIVAGIAAKDGELFRALSKWLLVRLNPPVKAE